MSIKSRLPKQPQKEKLSLEIFGLFFISVVISAFSFSFLYFTADSIIYNRLQAKGISLTNIQQAYVSGWMRNICLIAALIIFVVFFWDKSFFICSPSSAAFIPCARTDSTLPSRLKETMS